MPQSERDDHSDRLLDEALEDTFPASDPPSITQPHDLEDDPPPVRP